MGLSDILARTKSAYNNEFPSTGWKPIDPLPAGFVNRTREFLLPLSEFTSFEFSAVGSWAKGTVEFVREEVVAVEREGEGEEGGKVGARTRECRVVVEARSNSEQLIGDWQCRESVGDYRVGFELKTGDSTPLAATLSFHLTFHLPALLSGLNSLSVTCDRFRLLFHPSLSSRFSIASLNLTTTDAPISLQLTDAGIVHIKNQCILDPSKGKQLKTTSDLISGAISAEQITLQCHHGAISGEYQTTVGPLQVSTTNFPISGTFTSATTLHLSTTNNSLSGSFTSLALPTQLGKGQPGLTIDTAQGRVEGMFRAPAGVRVTTKNAPILGEFAVAGGGEGLVLRTSYFKIEAKVELISPLALALGGREGGGVEGRGRRESTDTMTNESMVVGSPTGSMMTSFSSEPPLYSPPPSVAPAAAASSSSSSSTSRVTVEAETSDGMISLEYVRHPCDVVLRSEATTSGGAKVVVKHPEGWEGTFAASTILANTVSLDVLPASSSSFVDTTPPPRVEYTTKKRWEIAGFVGSSAGGAGGSGNSTRARTTGVVEIVIGA